MVQIDSKNKQLRRRIENLNEDISVLRNQIKRLERKVYQRAKMVDHKK
jgi:chaperonin cofactor prefoldin